jgi:hypothetical protein
LIRTTGDIHRLEFRRAPAFQPAIDRRRHGGHVNQHDGDFFGCAAQPEKRRLSRLVDPAAPLIA